VTVSADVEKVKLDELPVPEIVVSQPSDDETFVAPEGTAEPVPDAEIACGVPEPATVPEKEPDVPVPAVPEVSTEVVEGSVVQLSEEEDGEEMLDDGTTVRRKVTTTKHVRPVTTIVHKIGGAEEQFTVEKLLGKEMDEQVLVLEPGTVQLRENQLEKETVVTESEDQVEGGVWIKRKVTTVTVKQRKTSVEQRETEKPSAALPCGATGAEEFTADQNIAQVPTSVAVSAEVPVKESLDLNASFQPSVLIHQKDITEQQSAQRETEKPSATLPSVAVGAEEFPADQKVAQMSTSAAVSAEVPVKESLDLNASSQPSVHHRKKDVGLIEVGDEQQSASLTEMDSAGRLQGHEEVESDRKPEDDQSRAFQSKPSIIPVKLTKLEPLSKDRANANADSAEVEPKPPSVEERDATKPQQARNGSPTLSVVRLTKLEPLSFNSSTAADQPRPEPAAETRDDGLPQSAPVGLQADQPQDPDVVQRATEDTATTTVPLDDDLGEARATVDKVGQTVDQFTVAPSSVGPAADDEITATVTAAPGSLHITAGSGAWVLRWRAA